LRNAKNLLPCSKETAIYFPPEAHITISKPKNLFIRRRIFREKRQLDLSRPSVFPHCIVAARYGHIFVKFVVAGEFSVKVSRKSKFV